MTVTLRMIRAAALAAPLLLAAFEAQAHAHLVTSAPAENATVASPQALSLEFSEKLEGKFSGADLMKADGTAVPLKSKVGAKSITATPGAALAPGAYMVMWHAVAADGHKSTGQYGFTVK